MTRPQRGPDGSALARVAGRLREALTQASYRYDAVAELLGPLAHAALGRNETTPGLRRTSDGSPLATLVRLFLLQASVPRTDAERALTGLVDELVAAGLLTSSGGETVACLDIRPYAATDATGGRDLWVASDLTPGLDGSPTHVGPDHVLGVSPASVSLAQLTVRQPVERALDLGTGCGVQALHLAAHAESVVATDVNTRALTLAAFTLALNDVDRVDVRDGSFLEPVAGERFDLIATNPPFVISPGTGERLVYRDSGLPGDRAVELIVRAAPDHLTDGGWCQVLANWVVPATGSWDQRLASWLDERCDALVVQREVLDPAEYVELWLKDSGHHGGPDYAARYDTWLSWLTEEGVAGVGFGWINLRRRSGDAADGRHELRDWPYAVEQPIAQAIEEWASAVDAAVAPADLAAATLLRAADVVQETVGPPGAEHPERVVLRRQRGFRRARTVDTVEAALVGACDGDLPVGRILAAIAQLEERDPVELAAAYLPAVRDLVAEGYLGFPGTSPAGLEG